MSEQETETIDAGKLMENAQQAINRGDVVNMLDALAESRYLDGLTRRLEKKWDSLPALEVMDCIGQAVDAACARAFRGKPIRNLGAWLWRTAHNIANDRWHSHYADRVDLDDASVPDMDDTMESELEREQREEFEDSRRKELVRIARGLLPRIGTGQIVDVMELVIDAAENEIPYLPASEIAESLGISNPSVRSLLSRGFDRLRRLATEEGVEISTDFLETDDDDTD